jgi:ferrous iron transport protein A
VVKVHTSEKILSCAKVGVKGVVSHFKDEHVACRLISMGLVPGCTIEILHKAPFGGGWYVKSDCLHIAMRSEEACCIVLR